MLLKIGRPIRVFFFPLFLLITGLTGCRHDPSSESEEQSVYFADYESPSAKWGFMNPKGEVVISPVYDAVGLFSEGMAAVNKNGLWGFVDEKGKLRIKPAYKSAWAFHEKKARVLPFGNHQQFIDQKGKIIKSDVWAAADDFSDGLARVKVGDSYGYIDSSGAMVIQPNYTRGWNFKNGVCIVEYQDKLGLIDRQGSYIIQPEFDDIKISGQQNIILCHCGYTSTAYDVKGNELASLPNCKMIDSDGLIISLRKKDQMYLFNLLSKINITSSSFTNFVYLEDSLWAGKTKDGYMLFNQLGQPLSPIAYDQINKFSGGYAAFNKGDYWGYINTKGVEKTSDEFGLAWDYKEGLARVAFKDGIAFIDDQQKLAFYPPEGSIDLRDFSEGMSAVQFP